MENILNVKTTKFPYFFWSFNQSFKCDINFDKLTYKNLEVNFKLYKIKSFNFYLFLTLKYFPIFVVFFIVFNIYDFYLNQRNILAYTLAFCLVLGVNFFENLTRQIMFFLTFCVSCAMAYLIDDFSLPAYTLKYFIFLSVLILLYFDFKFKIFEIVDENNKAIAHFLISKKYLEGKYNEKL